MNPDLSRGLYTLASYLLTPFALARLGIKSRKNSGYRQHIGERFGFVEHPVRCAKHIHFHAVSVGETLAAEPMVKLLAEQYPDLSISLSVTTPTGRDQAEKRMSQLAQINYLPFDTPAAVKRFLRRVKPDVLVMVETELWPNLVDQCQKNNIATLLLNGRMSAKSARNYQKTRSLTRQMMSQIDLVSAQFEDDAERFLQLGSRPETVFTLGNLKFDTALSTELKVEAAQLRELWQLQERPLWIAASTHPGEEEHILKVHQALLESNPNLFLVLVPRHPERRSELETVLDGLNLDFVVRSDLGAESRIEEDTKVLLVDTLGELNKFYGLSDIAFVGGSLIPHGGHNPIEPALWELPILTGRHCHNFMEITEQLVAAGSVHQCDGGSGLRQQLQELLQSKDLREQRGKSSQAVLRANQGSLERQKALIERLLYPSESGLG